MSDPSICPSTRLRCDTVLACWLIHCSKDRSRRERPIHERELTQAEKYALAMADKKRAAVDGRDSGMEGPKSRSVPNTAAENSAADDGGKTKPTPQDGS